MSLVTNSVKFHDRSIAWRVAVLFSQAKMRPPVFDVFYLHKYSHGFSQFPWLIIRFFLKSIGRDHGNTTEASVTFGDPSQRFLQALGISSKSSESPSRKSKHSLRFLERVQVSLTLLDSDRLCGFAEALVVFVNPSQRFLWVLGVSPKASESSSKWSESSLGFLCDPQIVITVLYKYEALPLQNIVTFTSLNSLDLRSDLRLSA